MLLMFILIVVEISQTNDVMNRVVPIVQPQITFHLRNNYVTLKISFVPFSDIVLKKIDRAKTLSDVNCKGSVGKKKLSIDSTILFSRLLIIMQRSPNMEPYFSYELTSEPSALFKDGALRKADKSVLARELKKSLKADSTPTEPKKYVIDGGWLLHRVKWQKGFLYSEIINQYVDYVTRHYGVNVVIVFDGYGTMAPRSKITSMTSDRSRHPLTLFLMRENLAFFSNLLFLPTK